MRSASVSNGGNAVMRFAMLYPELCRGLVVVTSGISAKPQDLGRLRGLPIDMYVGSKDECGFYKPMMELEASLRAVGQAPAASLRCANVGATNTSACAALCTRAACACSA